MGKIPSEQLLLVKQIGTKEGKNFPLSLSQPALVLQCCQVSNQLTQCSSQLPGFSSTKFPSPHTKRYPAFALPSSHRNYTPGWVLECWPATTMEEVTQFTSVSVLCRYFNLMTF